MAFMTPDSEAMTGWMLRPVRKRMSSMTSRSVGSTMARVRKLRIRWIGMTLYFLATSFGMRLMTSG